MADIDSEKERRLVADLLEGDESAFCELYALYKDRLMWFSLKFLKASLAVFIPAKIQLSVPYAFCILVYGAFSASPTSFS